MTQTEIGQCVEEKYILKLRAANVMIANLICISEPCDQSRFAPDRTDLVLTRFTCTPALLHNSLPIQVLDCQRRFILEYLDRALTCRIGASIFNSSGLLLCVPVLFEYAEMFQISGIVLKSAICDENQNLYVEDEAYEIKRDAFTSVQQLEALLAGIIEWGCEHRYGFTHTHICLEIHHSAMLAMRTIRSHVLSFDDDHHKKHYDYEFELERRFAPLTAKL